MNVLVCVKRVPQTGGRIVLTPDGQAIDTRFLGEQYPVTVQTNDSTPVFDPENARVKA